MSRRVIWTEVGPRDGLQSWSDSVPTDVKVRLVLGLLDAGAPRVEATAFVSSRWVPKLADAGELVDALGADVADRLRVLVPNLRGLQRAVEHGVRNVVVTIAATDEFNRRNVNRSVADSLVEVSRIVAEARGAGCRVDAAVSVAFGCPYAGEVDPRRVVELCAELVERGVDEVGIADTIGVADPGQVRVLVALVRGAVAAERLSVHFHDTRAMGVANVVAAFESGVDRFEGSVGGIGGCPFAPRATGNVCSEDALHALLRLGAEVVVDLDRYCSVAQQLADDLGQVLPGRLYRAGMWQPTVAAVSGA